ncbi:MAG TPA: signal peptide peptidase SppA [Bacteroidetes bacterium]|nr:signal peptide peptidase SppA [Bacteroidota bacterium]
MSRGFHMAVIIHILVITFCSVLSAQVAPDFLRLPHHSVAVTGDALAPVVNPAGLGVRSGESLLIFMPYSTGSGLAGWGYAVGGEGIGLVGEFVRNDVWSNRNRHTFGFGLGYRGLYLGAAYAWTKGVDRENNWDIGLMARPFQFLSFGGVARGVNEPRINAPADSASAMAAVGFDLGLAFRPLALFTPIGGKYGTRITLTADAGLRKYPVTYLEATPDRSNILDETDGYLDNVDWKLGASVEFVPGIAGYVDYSPEVKQGPHAHDGMISTGLSLNFGRIGFGADRERGAGDGVSYLSLTEFHRPSSIWFHRQKFVEIRLKGPIIEYEGSASWFRPDRRTVYELVRKIERCGDDPDVAGILLRIEDFSAGLAKIQEIRDALREFMDSGRSVVVYLESCGNGGYYLASVADYIFMNPVGDLNLTGLSAHAVFLRGTLDRIGIDPNYVHAGGYKSASESLTREDMSPSQREELNFVLDELYDDFVAAIADGRGYIEDQVRELVEDGPFTAADAFSAGLVDSLVYKDELKDLLKDYFGLKTRLVTERKYDRRTTLNDEWYDLRRKSIAVVYGCGVIVHGASSGGGLFSDRTMGSETIARALRKARESKSVAAIVFRIDSPGGSMLASDIIMREVKLCTRGEERKPLIVSMSDVAGSGGYYIACMADTIIAMPGTITGSIGVISGKLAYNRLQGKIGITTETLRRGKHADMWSGHRSFTDEEWGKVRRETENYYRIFLERVAEGRGIDTSEVNRFAQGRIWTGSQAAERKLVDLTGGLDLAIQIAAFAGGVKDGESFGVKTYPDRRQLGFGDEILWVAMKRVPADVRRLAASLNGESRWEAGEPLLLMPYRLEIE